MPAKIESIARALFPDDYHDGTDCRAEVGREGEPCRHCAYQREEWLKRVASVKAAMEAAHVPADHAAEALRRAESFIVGFEGDETQDGITDLLAAIRGAIAGAPRDELQAIRVAVKAYDDKMCDTANDGMNALPPDGDDYNEIFAIIMHGVPADPMRDAAPDLLHWLKAIAGRLLDLREHLSETEIGLALAAIAKAEGRP